MPPKRIRATAARRLARMNPRPPVSQAAPPLVEGREAPAPRASTKAPSAIIEPEPELDRFAVPEPEPVTDTTTPRPSRTSSRRVSPPRSSLSFAKKHEVMQFIMQVARVTFVKKGQPEYTDTVCEFHEELERSLDRQVGSFQEGNLWSDVLAEANPHLLKGEEGWGDAQVPPRELEIDSHFRGRKNPDTTHRPSAMLDPTEGYSDMLSVIALKMPPGKTFGLLLRETELRPFLLDQFAIGWKGRNSKSPLKRDINWTEPSSPCTPLARKGNGKGKLFKILLFHPKFRTLDALPDVALEVVKRYIDQDPACTVIDYTLEASDPCLWRQLPDAGEYIDVGAGSWSRATSQRYFGRPCARRGIALLQFMGNATAHAGQHVQAGRFDSLESLYTYCLDPFAWLPELVYQAIKATNLHEEKKVLQIFYNGMVDMQHLSALPGGSDEGDVSQYDVFLTHFKQEASPEARWLKQTLVEQGKSRIFLDCDALMDMHDLAASVCASKVVVLLQTKSVYSRPWCILEIISAIDGGVPIVCVNITSSVYTYDFEESREFLLHLDTTLDQTALDLLTHHGIDPVDAAYKLSNLLVTIISVPLNMACSEAHLQASISDIMSAIQRAEKKTIRTLPDRSAWLASRPPRVVHKPEAAVLEYEAPSVPVVRPSLPKTKRMRDSAWKRARTDLPPCFLRELDAAGARPMYVQPKTKDGDSFGYSDRESIERVKAIMGGTRGASVGVFGSTTYNPKYTNSVAYPEKGWQGVEKIVKAAAVGLYSNQGFSQLVLGGAWDGVQGSFLDVCNMEDFTIIHVLPKCPEAVNDIMDILWVKPDDVSEEEWRDALWAAGDEDNAEAYLKPLKWPHLKPRERRGAWHLIFAGDGWTQRNLIIAGLTSQNVVCAGGPGTITEVSGARENGSGLIPLHHTGGATEGQAFGDRSLRGITKLKPPEGVAIEDWRVLLGRGNTNGRQKPDHVEQEEWDRLFPRTLRPFEEYLTGVTSVLKTMRPAMQLGTGGATAREQITTALIESYGRMDEATSHSESATWRPPPNAWKQSAAERKAFLAYVQEERVKFLDGRGSKF